MLSSGWDAPASLVPPCAEYVRFHGLLDDDMSVVLQGDNGELVYSFANVFNVFDFMLSIGVRVRARFMSVWASCCCFCALLKALL